MRRPAGSPPSSARSGRSAPDAHSLRGEPAATLPTNPADKTAPIPKSVKFSDPTSVHFSKPIDKVHRTHHQTEGGSGRAAADPVAVVGSALGAGVGREAGSWAFPAFRRSRSRR